MANFDGHDFRIFFGDGDDEIEITEFLVDFPGTDGDESSIPDLPDAMRQLISAMVVFGFIGEFETFRDFLYFLVITDPNRAPEITAGFAEFTVN